jgi:very-short-patch-repair endonuclease
MIQSRVASERWTRLPGAVYRLAGTPPTWPGCLVAACFAYGEDALVSWRAAAALWELPHFPQGIVEVTVGRTRGRIPGIIVHRVAVGRADRAVLAGLPVTTPARTLIDIASVVPVTTLEEAINDALARRLVTVRRLGHRIEAIAVRGRPGIARIRRVVERLVQGPAPMSVLETRLLSHLRRSKFREPILQHRIRDRGVVVAVVDFAYPEAMVAVEADGYRWHSSPSKWRNDLARRNVLTGLGWRVVHVTSRDLIDRPDDIVATIAAAYAQGIGQRKRWGAKGSVATHVLGSEMRA